MVWREILRSSFTSVLDLARFLELPDELIHSELLLDPGFSLLVPRRLAEKMAKGTIDDPLFRQFVPLRQERISSEGFLAEPVEDQRFQKSPRLLEKYQKRALLITTGACAMNCRFCFRQNYPYPKSGFSQGNVFQGSAFEPDLAYVRSNPEIEELILSGGDPLSLSNRMLGSLFSDIGQMSQLKRVRIHTRLPIGIPERIDDAFCGILSAARQQIIFVLHVNHVRELDADLVAAMKKIGSLGIPVLSQTVLLSGVNDSEDALYDLFTGLGNAGIIPYYLHQLDRVMGAQHFEVPSRRGLDFIESLQQKLPGYLVPRFVEEIPGRPSKTAVSIKNLTQKSVK